MYEVREFNLDGVEGFSPRAIELHLGLYKGYVEQVNRLLAEIREQTRAAGTEDPAHHARARRLAFEWNGMVLHELFFEALRGPGSVVSEGGAFAEAVDQSFGGFDAWRSDLLATAGLRGIGWVATVRDRQTNRIFNAWLEEHHLGMPAGVETVLVLDLWEHAYLLDYPPSRKTAYVAAVLANVDWSIVEARCTVAPA